jgi:tetratricopeptide (TPR) repeat protein
MSFLDKLFGKKKPAPDKASATPATPAAPALDAPTANVTPAAAPARADDAQTIRMFDAYGREMLIPKKQWREKVLPDSIQQAWDDPERLAGIVLSSIGDGYAMEVAQAARRLYETDTNAERGATLFAIIQMRTGQTDEAEKTLRDYIEKQGESGVILTNLAQVQQSRGQHKLAMATLWHALELDPNMDKAFGWYTAECRESGGEESGLEAVRCIAALPGAWRAMLWLANDSLKRSDIEEALEIYKDAFSIAPDPPPADMLMQMSGDLGTRGYQPEIINLVQPRFNPQIHGLVVGNNIIKALLDLGQIDDARTILDQLYALKRPDWQNVLAQWDADIAKARIEVMPDAAEKKPTLSMFTIDGPVWLRKSSPASRLRKEKEPGSVIVAIVSSSFSRAANTEAKPAHFQLSDAPGRFCRALPLFMAQELHMRTNATGRVLQPWVAGESGGFALYGAAPDDASAVALSRMGGEATDYAVTLHIDGKETPWAVSMRLIRAIDSTLIGTAKTTISQDDVQPAFRYLADELMRICVTQAQVSRIEPPDYYRLPNGHMFGWMQVLTEQALSVGIASMDNVGPSFLNGERKVLSDMLGLCLAAPDNAIARLILAQTLFNMRKVRPNIADEFKERAMRLQNEKPLPAAVQNVVLEMLE